MAVLTLDNIEVSGKRVLVREDLNVPVKDGKVSSDARIRAALPTIKQLMNAGAKVILVSHLGRPTEGLPINEQQQFSLIPVAAHLSHLLGKDIPLMNCGFDAIPELADGDVILMENVRINPGEKKNNDELAHKMASACDVFVMDAFGTAHRAQASTHGVAKYAPIACAGPLLAAELSALGRALDNPSKPVTAIVGGSKVSTKLTVLESLSGKVDQLIVGGGIANTFLAAAGYPVGKSLHEKSLIPAAKDLMAKVNIPMPVDVVVAKVENQSQLEKFSEFIETAEAITKPVSDVLENEMILDVGPETSQQFANILTAAKTIIWNGPVGVFEVNSFGNGTKVLTQAIADSDAFSIAGGGDTLAAVDKYQVKDKISYISTGGGAFLEFVEGQALPAVAILEERATDKE